MESNLDSATTSKKSNPPSTRGRKKKANTTRQELYRKTDIITLPSTKVDVQYKKPDLSQYASIFTFIVESVKKYMFTPVELGDYKQADLNGEALSRFINFLNTQEEVRGSQLVIMMLLDNETKTHLHEAIIDCFPGIDPKELSTDYYIDIFVFLTVELLKNLATLTQGDMENFEEAANKVAQVSTKKEETREE